MCVYEVPVFARFRIPTASNLLHCRIEFTHLLCWFFSEKSIAGVGPNSTSDESAQQKYLKSHKNRFW